MEILLTIISIILTVCGGILLVKYWLLHKRYVEDKICLENSINQLQKLLRDEQKLVDEYFWEINKKKEC